MDETFDNEHEYREEVRQPRGRLEKLRDRPKEQKTVLAGTVALIVVGVLFLGWVFIFFNNIADTNEAAPAETADTIENIEMTL